MRKEFKVSRELRARRSTLHWYSALGTGVQFSVGSAPQGVAFDGTNIWVANAGSNTATKLPASTGATVGTYNVGGDLFGVAFDGTNIWVTHLGGSTVAKM
jgi:DNA-binding beta-propeller fold protein YncE